MPLTYWGIVGGIISVVGLLLLSILTLYSGPKGSLPRRKPPRKAEKPEPLIPGRAA